MSFCLQGDKIAAIVAPTVTLGVLAIVLAVLGWLFCVVKKKRQTEGTYRPSAEEQSGASSVAAPDALKLPKEERLIWDARLYVPTNSCKHVHVWRGSLTWADHWKKNRSGLWEDRVPSLRHHNMRIHLSLHFIFFIFSKKGWNISSAHVRLKPQYFITMIILVVTHFCFGCLNIQFTWFDLIYHELLPPAKSTSIFYLKLCCFIFHRASIAFKTDVFF